MSAPTPSLYAQRQALHICVRCGSRDADPFITLCTLCREKARQQKAAWNTAHPDKARAHATRYRDQQAAATGPNLLACCGRWLPIEHVPLTTPCCQRTFFAEVAYEEC